MARDGVKKAVVAAAIAGATIALCAYLDSQDEKKSAAGSSQGGGLLEQLLKDQFVANTVTLDMVMSWYKENAPAGKNEMFVGYITDEIANKLFKSSDTCSIDRSKYLLQLITCGDKVHKIRLINFNALDEALSKLLDENNGWIAAEN